MEVARNCILCYLRHYDSLYWIKKLSSEDDLNRLRKISYIEMDNINNTEQN